MEAKHEQETIVALLRERARLEPEHVLYTILDERGEHLRDITYGELDERARAIAVRLRQFSSPGERVMQVFPAGADFLFAFYGTLYSGAVGIPLSRPGKASEVRRLVNTARDARPTCGLTSAEVLAEACELSREGVGATIPWIVPEEVDLSLAKDWTAPDLESDSLAYLQYTSGSTGDPKGVMITHRNVSWNQEMIHRAFGHGPETTTVSWLPHSHDMGLIGSVLNPLFVNAKAVLMSPSAFVRDPLRWLRAISKYRGRTSGGPNFAFELCVRRLAKNAGDLGLDLSSWDVAYCGSEPVRAETLESFVRAFERYGFRRDALLPCYGLAEATLLVSGEKGHGLQTQRFAHRTHSVSCGRPAPLQDVRIVRLDDFTECPDGAEGEVWVSGPHISAGYFGKPVESEATFGAQVVGVPGRFLRTGDLGARLDGGTIHVTGRIRDVLIIRGRNHYPQDIEATAETTDQVRAAGSAAFSFDVGGEERIGIVAEVARFAPGQAQAICESIRAAVSDAHDVRLDVVVLIAPQSLLKTTSGKVERQGMRKSFLEGTLRALGYDSQLGKQSELWDSAYRDLEQPATNALREVAAAAPA